MPIRAFNTDCKRKPLEARHIQPKSSRDLEETNGKVGMLLNS